MNSATYYYNAYFILSIVGCCQLVGNIGQDWERGLCIGGFPTGHWQIFGLLASGVNLAWVSLHKPFSKFGVLNGFSHKLLHYFVPDKLEIL